MRKTIIPVLTLLVLLTTSVTGGNGKWIPTNGPNGTLFTSFVFPRGQSNVLFALGAPRGDPWMTSDPLYVSMDSGASWRPILWNNRVLTGVLKSDPHKEGRLLFIGSGVDQFSNGVLESTDFGISWRIVATGPFWFHDFEFHPFSSDVLYGINSGGYRDPSIFYKSTDGGKTWMKKATLARPKLEGADIAVDQHNGEILYVVLGNGHVYKSTNGGNSFQDSSRGLLRLERGVRSLAIDWKVPEVLYSAGSEGVFKTTDGGSNWFSTKCNCRVREIVIHPNNNEVLYAAGHGDTGVAQAVKSIDGGKTWVSLGLPRFDTRPYIALAIDPRAPKILFAGAELRGILKSTDAGLSWHSSNRGARLPVINLTADKRTPGHMFAVADRGFMVKGIVFETFNGGANWKWTTTLDSYDVERIIVHPKNPLILAAIAYVKPSDRIFVSTNGGKTWQMRGEATRVFFDPSRMDTIFGVDTYLIRKSTDLGLTWTTITPTLNRANDESLTDLAIDPKDGRILYATTLGSGDEDIKPPAPARLFKSTNGGLNWNVIQARSLPRTDIFWEVELNPKTPSNVYIVGGSPGGASAILSRSTDAGKNWLQIDQFPGEFLSIDSLNPQRMLTYNLGGDRLFWSRDGGNTWQSINTEGLFSIAQPTFLTSAFFSPWQAKIVFAAVDGVKTYALK